MPAQTPDTDELVKLFFDAPDALGQLTRVGHVPAPYDKLLDHDQHMTVTVEDHHDSRVDVQVLDVSETDGVYARKILLTRQSDDQIVQFGIVRIHMNFLPEPVGALIRAQKIPLGRVLIENDVMRQVELVQLFDVSCGPELQKLFGMSNPGTTYGRTALIHVGDDPVIELLEIVAPEPMIE
jgi:chorismate-pyruvate lyase